jgi:hypothetical protein
MRAVGSNDCAAADTYVPSGRTTAPRQTRTCRRVEHLRRGRHVRAVGSNDCAAGGHDRAAGSIICAAADTPTSWGTLPSGHLGPRRRRARRDRPRCCRRGWNPVLRTGASGRAGRRRTPPCCRCRGSPRRARRVDARSAWEAPMCEGAGCRTGRVHVAGPRLCARALRVVSPGDREGHGLAGGEPAGGSISQASSRLGMSMSPWRNGSGTAVYCDPLCLCRGLGARGPQRARVWPLP